MKVARIYDFLDVRLEEMPVPAIAADEVLVRTSACGICSGDVVPWYIRKKAPIVFGHEPAGRIVEVGKGVTGLRAGDRVFVHHHAPCWRCRACARGEFVQCETWRSSRIDPGGMAEYFRVPATNLADTLVLPDSVSDEDGALVEPLACVVKSLNRANVIEDDTVLIIGLGVMGQMHVLLAREYGAGRIIGADLVATRCEWARKLGADHVIDSSRDDLAAAVLDLTNGAGAEVVIVGPATTDALAVGIRCVARGGTVVQFMGTEPGVSLHLDTNSLYFREVRLIPSYSCGPLETRAALRFVERGIVRAEQLVTHRFPLAGAAEAYRVAAQDRSAIKAMVVFDAEE